jgi:hypothetical protein
MITLDTQAIESQQLRLANQTATNYTGFRNVFNALEKQLKHEKLLMLNSGASRSKRRIILARRQDIVQKVNSEVTTMAMNESEANTLQYEFEQMRYYQSRMLTNFVQYTEERIAVQKEKMMARMTGFAKDIIDDIWEENSLSRHNRNHTLLCMLQNCCAKLSSDGMLPRIDQAETLLKYLEEEEVERPQGIEAIVLFNALQLLDLLCSQNWGNGKGNHKDEQRHIVHKMIRLVPYAFRYIRTWTEENAHLVALFAFQTFRALYHVLTILPALGSTSSATLGLGLGLGLGSTGAGGGTGGGAGGGRGGGGGGGRGDATPGGSMFGGGYGATTVGGVGAATTIGSLTFGYTASTYSVDPSSGAPAEQSTYYYSWSRGDKEDAHNINTTAAHSQPKVTRYDDADLAADVSLWLQALAYVKTGCNRNTIQSRNDRYKAEAAAAAAAAATLKTMPATTAAGAGIGLGIASGVAPVGGRGDRVEVTSPKASAAAAAAAAFAAATTHRTVDANTDADATPDVCILDKFFVARDSTASTATAASAAAEPQSAQAPPVRKKVQRAVCGELSALLGLGSSLTFYALQCGEKLAHILVTVPAEPKFWETPPPATNSAATAAVAAAAALANGNMSHKMTSSSFAIGFNESSIASAAAAAGTTTAAAATATGAENATSGSAAKIPAIPVFGSIAHGLLLACLDLAVLSSGRYCARLGPQGCPAAVAFHSPRFLKAADSEVAAALSCATACMSYGLFERTSLTILQHGYDIAAHRVNSYFFVTAWLQCCLAACLLCIEQATCSAAQVAAARSELHADLQASIDGAKRIEAAAVAATLRAQQSFGGGGVGGGGGARGGGGGNQGMYRGGVALNPLGGGGATAAAASSSRPTLLGGLSSRNPLGSQLSSASLFGGAGGGGGGGGNSRDKGTPRIRDMSLLLPLTTQFFRKEELVKFMSGCTMRIMAVTAQLRHVLSVAHLGILVTRLLARDLFMKRMRVEEMLEEPLLSKVLPMLDEQAAVALEEVNLNDGAERDPGSLAAEVGILDASQTVASPGGSGAMSPEPSMFAEGSEGHFGFSPPRSPSSPGGGGVGEAGFGDSVSFAGSVDSDSRVGSRAGGSRGGGSSSSQNVPSVPQFWKTWVANNLEKEFTGGDGFPAHRLTFVGLLQYVGETHLQSREVLEQLMLMIAHLCAKSQLCKFQLVDNGLPIVVQRILASQTDNVYLIALTEICSEALEVKI